MQTTLRMKKTDPLPGARERRRVHGDISDSAGGRAGGCPETSGNILADQLTASKPSGPGVTDPLRD
jgi:hypothetical protein